MPASKETIAEELRKYFKLLGLRQKEVAEKVGISKPHASNLISGRDGFGYISAHKFADAFPDLNVGYLVNGEGTLIKGGTHQIGSISNSSHIVNGSVSGDKLALEEENRRLKEELAKAAEEKDRLLGIIETLSRK